MRAKNLRGAGLLLLTSFIWGTAFVAQSMGNVVGPFTFNGVRNLVGCLCLLPIIFLIGRSRKRLEVQPSGTGKGGFLLGGLFCGLCLFGGSSLQQVGLQYTSAGKAGFLTALYIVIVPVLGLFLRRKLGLKIWVSVAIAAFGTFLLSVKEGFTIAPGDLYMILGAVVFSVHILVVDYFSPKTDAVKLSATQFFVCGLLSLAVAFVTETPQPAEILAAWGPILFTGVLSCGVAYTLQIVGQRDTPPAVASLIMSLESVFAVLAGWIVLGEQLAPKEALGCVLVFLAVVLAQIPLERLKKKPL